MESNDVKGSTVVWEKDYHVLPEPGCRKSRKVNRIL